MITIEVTTYHDKPLAHSIRADFDENGGTIGRAPESTLVLLDPERKISRTHAAVSFVDGDYILKDHGSLVPVVLNGDPLGNGNAARIEPGDEIRIAGYALSVRDTSAPATQEIPPAQGDAQTIASAVASAVATELASQARNDVAVEAQPVVAATVPNEVAAQPAVENLTEAVQAAPQETPREDAAPATRAAAEAPHEPPELPTAEGAIAAQAVSNEERAQPTTDDDVDMPEPVLSWTSAEQTGSVEARTTIILAPLGTSPERTAHESEGVAEPVAALGAAASDAPTKPADTPAATPPFDGNSSNDALLDALLKGAGLRGTAVPGGLTPERMKQLGEFVREATGGLLDLLAARALTKREVRADMTVIVAADNNPLKFSPDREAALTHLMVPRGRGFMPPLRAVTDAYDDLRAHQLGFMAGMRAALSVVLARFNPRALEERLTESTMVDSILPTHRKAKLWDLFGELYSAISKDAHNDFHTLFGHEFLRAYQAHVAKGPEHGDSRTRHP